jgi:hypothetical protein
MVAAAGGILSAGWALAAPAARPPAWRLLPRTTALFVSVADAPDIVGRFQTTALGQMIQDPQVAPLVQHLYGSLVGAAATVQDRVGMTLPELLSIPQGELTVAVVAPDKAAPAMVLVLDAGGDLSKARQLLRRGAEALEKSNAEKTEETVAGTKLTTYQYQISQQRQRAASFFEKDSTIVVGTDPGVLKQVLAAWSGKEGETLGQNEAFAAVRRHSRESKDQEPQITWYVDPIMLLRGAAQRNAGLQLTLALLPALGLDGLRGLGGSVSLDAGPFGSVVHAHLLLDTPRSGVLEMLAFGSGDTTPEPWVPADVATYVTLHWKFATTFKRLVSLYDSFRGEGALAKELGRVQEPTGLEIEKEVLPLLEGRVTFLAWVERPVESEASRKTLLALRLKDPAAARKLLQTVAKKNEASMSFQSYGGEDYYEITPPGAAANRPPDAPPLPQPCVGIVGEYLVVSERVLYRKVIEGASGASQGLAGELDFKLIASKIRRRAGTAKPAMISFDRPEESLRFLYELAQSARARERLRRGSRRNPLFRAIDAALEANRLPPFEVLSRYFAPGGAMVVDDETGIHFTSFSLRRKAP